MSKSALRRARRRPGRPHAALAVALAALLATSCAYFNTFHNAKSEFRKAEDERKSVSTGGGGEATYQKCIEKCQTLLRYYGKSKYVDDALYLIGMSRYHRGEYVQSRASFEDLCERFPKSEFVERALYWSGLAALHQGDAAAAAQSFQKLATEFPNSKLNEEAVFRSAEARLDDHDYERAREDLRAFMVAHPKSELTAEAQLRLARTYLEEKRPEEARTEYGKVLERNPSPEIRYEAQLNMALALRTQAEEVLANPALQRMRRERSASAQPAPQRPTPPAAAAVDSVAPLTPAQVDSLVRAEQDAEETTWTAEDEAQLQNAEAQLEEVWAQLMALRKPAAKLGRQSEHDVEIAVTLALRGQPGDAQDDLDQIARSRPRTDLALRARYEVGEILRRQGDFTKARVAYDEALREKRDGPVADLAQRRSSAIVLRTASLDKLRGAKVAVKRWRDVQAGLPVELDAKQKRALESKDGKENGGTKDAAGAGDSLGTIIAVQAEFETMAAEQLRVAEIDLFDLDQPLLALREFDRVLTEYEGSLQGPRAAFAVAWIHDRRLRDDKQAHQAYARLVQDYPGTPQAREAQAILEHWNDPGARPEVKGSSLRP